MAFSGSPYCSALSASAWRSMAASKPRSGSSSVPILSLSASSRPKRLADSPAGEICSRPKMPRNRLRTNEKPSLWMCLDKYSRVGASGMCALIFVLWSPGEERIALRARPLPQDPERLGSELGPRRAQSLFSDGDHRSSASVGGAGRRGLAGAVDLLRGARLERRVLADRQQAPLRHGRRRQREDPALLARGGRGKGSDPRPRGHPLLRRLLPGWDADSLRRDPSQRHGLRCLRAGTRWAARDDLGGLRLPYRLRLVVRRLLSPRLAPPLQPGQRSVQIGSR